MNRVETPNANTRFSIRSLLTLIAFAAVVFVAVRKHQQNQRLQQRIDELTSQLEHLDAIVEDAREKLKLLKDIANNEPALSVQQMSPHASP